MKLTKRILCLTLALVMVLGYIPGVIRTAASQEDGLCAEHHPEHDAQCGFAPAASTPCNHAQVCDDTCKKPVTDCKFVHEGCGCAPAVQGQDCNGKCELAMQKAAVVCSCTPNEDGSVTHDPEACDYEALLSAVEASYSHNGDCGYAEGKDAVQCSHECTEQNGCITKQCSHTGHDENCGFSETEAVPCKYAGAPCAACAEGTVDKECEENCMLSAGHEGGCVLPCAQENCVKAAGHEDGCARACGCPVEATEHLEDCPERAAQTPGDIAAEDNNALMIQNARFDETDTQKMYFDLYFGQDTQDMSQNRKLGKNDLSSLSLKDETVVRKIFFDEVNTCFYVYFVKANVPACLVYTQYDENSNPVEYTLEIRQLKSGMRILSRYTGGWEQTESMMIAGQQVKYQFFQGEPNGPPDMSSPLTAGIVGDGQVVSVSESPDSNGYYTVTALKDGFGKIQYKIGDTVIGEHSVEVFSSENLKLFFWESDEVQGLLPPDQGIHAGTILMAPESSIRGKFMLGSYGPGGRGPQSSIYMPGTITLSAGSNLTMNPTDGKDTCVIAAGSSNGMSTVTYTEGNLTCSIEISVLGSASEDAILHYPDVDQNGNTYPVSCVNLPSGGSLCKKFYFGDTPLTMADNPTVFGPISVMDGGNGMLKIQASPDKTGTGYLEYKTVEGEGENQRVITNCFVMNVVNPMGYQVPTGTQSGSYLHYGNTIIGFGDIGHGASEDVETMILDHELPSGYSNEYAAPYAEKALLAAISSNGQPDTDLLGRIDNVVFSVLSCTYTDGIPTSGNELRVLPEQLTIKELSGGVKTWMNTFVAGSGVGFRAKMGMRFDLEETRGEEKVIRRISLFTSGHNMFMGNEVRIFADDIESAAQLNVVLSSYESLVNWVKTKPDNGQDVGREWVDTAYTINIILPARSLTDTVVVAQPVAELPFTDIPISTPDFRIILWGSGNGSNKTTLAGFISKGSVFGLHNIAFKANKNATMIREGHERPFTCGVMADSKWSGQAVYDTTKHTLVQPGNRTLESWGDNGTALWHCDIITMSMCSFDGFDYGTYSTPNGYVGGGKDISFRNCYYGLYIDCRGKSGWNMLKSFSDYDGYDFQKNVVAVRIKGLQANMTPYEFRIHDSDFINNYLEFWIDEYQPANANYLQNYYFYRNHYRGGWKLNNGNGSNDQDPSGYGWVAHETAPDSENLPDVHRAPRYSDTLLNTTDNGVSVVISGTPGKAMPNLASNAMARAAGAEGYWIYDGDDQITRIEDRGEKLPIAQDSLESLTEDATVSVVTEGGSKTKAIWTFKGGEGE